VNRSKLYGAGLALTLLLSASTAWAQGQNNAGFTDPNAVPGAAAGPGRQT
jgi:hypothetical protein